MIWVLLIVLSACVPPHKGWTRADVVMQPAQQQMALDRDRTACSQQLVGRPLLHQALLGDLEMTMCLERFGWRRVP